MGRLSINAPRFGFYKIDKAMTHGEVPPSVTNPRAGVIVTIEVAGCLSIRRLYDEHLLV
jgi:hypothetical protein